MARRRGRGAAAATLSVLALVAAACGTRVDKEAYLASLNQVGVPVTGGEGDLAGGASSPAGDAVTGGATGAGSPGVPGPVGATRATSPSAAPSKSGGSAAAPAAALDGVSTEVVGPTIEIGMHVPETGAAPLPTNFKDVFDVVERYMNDNPVHGRNVRFRIEDDGYDPAKGQAACRKIADAGPLLAIGHTQPGVEHACAGLFGARGIPYLMRGTNAEVLDGRPLSWFGTPEDRLQGALLGDYVINKLGGRGKKAAVVYENDQPATRDGFVARIEAGGGKVVAVEEANARHPDFSAIITKLQGASAEYVLLSQPPVNAIKIAVQSQGQGYHPQWLGGGTYWNYNLVLESAGMALDGAISFSPWPSIDAPGAADFTSVYARYRPGKDPPDYGLVVWGWTMLVRSAIEKAGPELSRASLVSTLQSYTYASPFWNPLTFTPSDHRGATAVAVFRADGQAKRWRQIAGFTDRF